MCELRYSHNSGWVHPLNVYNVTTFQVVQFTLHVVDVLIDLLHSLTVPHDLLSVNLGNGRKLGAQCI